MVSYIGNLFDDKTIKPSINYIYPTNDDFTNHILMVGLNKYSTVENYNLYGGLLLSMGNLKWETNPVPSTLNTDYKTSSMVSAIQVGAEYKLTETLLLGVNTKYYMSDYSTTIEPTSSIKAEINHKSSYSVALGVRYSF